MLSGFQQIKIGTMTNGKNRWKTTKNQCSCDGTSLVTMNHVNHCHLYDELKEDIYQKQHNTLDFLISRANNFFNIV